MEFLRESNEEQSTIYELENDENEIEMKEIKIEWKWINFIK